MPSRRIFFWLCIGYAAIRLFSFWWPPHTALWSGSLVNSLISVGFIVLLIVLLARRDERAWFLIALEFILGGSGGYFGFAGLTLRTWFLGLGLLGYAVNLLYTKQLTNIVRNDRKLVLLFATMLIVVFSAGLRAYFIFARPLHAILAGSIPYLFLLYFWPLRDAWKSAEFRRLVQYAVYVAIIGGFIHILLTFCGFTTGLFSMQGYYYHWFRDVALGKITELPFHFYRIVLNDHLLLVPLLVWCAYQLLSRWTYKLGILYGLLLFIFALNLTRIYLVAFVAAFLFLANRTNWRRALAYLIGSLVIFALCFTMVHLVASRGQSLGWELFGLRLQSIVSPTLEDSSLSRLILLPEILSKIKNHPVWGAGLTDTVTVYNPILKSIITTSQFDWGYLQVWDELGLIGLVLWLYFLFFIFQRAATLKKYGWPIASVLALAIINITSPALFHVLGCTWFAMVLAVL